MQIAHRIASLGLLTTMALASPMVYADTLSTGVTSTGVFEGAFFDVTTNGRAITINGFEATLIGNVNARAYYRTGSYQGFENNAAGWTLLSSQNIAGAISDDAQTLNSINAGTLVIPANQTYGFLIYTGKGDNPGEEAVGVGFTGPVTVSDTNISIYAGDGSGGGDLFTPFDGSESGYAWRGSVIYSLGDLTTPPPPPTDPIPKLTGLPAIPGIGARPAVLNLAADKGPGMVECLMESVRKLLGTNAVYLGQDANGVAKISQGSKVITFYPLEASTSTNVSEGVHLGSSNVQKIGTSCGNFNIVPAMHSLGEFGAFLNGQGLTAQTNSQGVMTVTVDNKVYVVRPDYFVSTGAAAGPSLLMGADGLYRFTDSAGNQQVLRTAFLEPDALSAQLAGAMGGLSTFQTDGTAVFTQFNGQQFVATPDMTLTAASGANSTKLWWQEGASNHYLVRSSTLTQAQGLTLQPR